MEYNKMCFTNVTLVCVTLLIIVIVIVMLKYKSNQENFESSGSLLNSRVIDFVSVVPDPINNPDKLVVVIGYGKYIWKYDIIPKILEKLTDIELNSCGLRLITGYPKLITEEWSFLSGDFTEDLTGVFNPYRWLWVVKNSQWISRNNYGSDAETGLLANSSWFANLKTITDINNIDTFHSHPDMCFGTGDRNTYLQNEYPNFSTKSSATIYNTKNYVFSNVYSKTKQYIMTLPSNSWTNVKNSSWKEYNKSDKSVYTHTFNHLALQTNSVDSQVFLNDLQTCLMKTPTNSKSVNDCKLWYQIKRPIRAVCAIAGYVYVLSSNKLWKYTPSGNNLLLEAGYPCRYNEEWTNLNINDNVDAVVMNGDDIYIFKGDMVIMYDVVNDTLIDKRRIESVFPEVGRIDTIYQNKNIISIYCDDVVHTYDLATGVPVYVKKGSNLSNAYFQSKYINPLTGYVTTLYKTYTDINGTKVSNGELYHACAKTIFCSNDVDEIIIYQQSINGSNSMMNNVSFDGNMITALDTTSGLYSVMKTIGLNNIPEMSGILSIKSIVYIFQDNKVHLYKSQDGSFVGTYNIADIWKNDTMVIPSRCDCMFYDQDKYAWFFKNGNVYKMNIDTYDIETGPCNKYFEDLNNNVESVFYHKSSDILVCVQGISYTYYKYNAGKCELIDIDLTMDTLIVNTVSKGKYLVFNVMGDTAEFLNQKKMISLENYIKNGDFADLTRTDTVGSTDGSKVILSAARDVVGLPITANVLKYSITSGNVFNMQVQIPTGAEDLVFSFYMKTENPVALNLKIMSKNNTSYKMFNITNEWKRYSLYHKHKTGMLEITGYVESPNYVNMYVSGLLLENNVRPSMYFNGKAVVIQDKNTANKYYAYNVNMISNYPNTTMDIETLMSYRADNTPYGEYTTSTDQPVAIKLDGKLTYILVPITTPMNLNKTSITFWLKLRDTQPGDVIRSDTLSLSFDKTLKMKVGTFEHTFSSISFVTNKWYFVSLVFTDKSARLYAYNYYEEVAIPTELINKLIIENMVMGLGLSGDIGNLTVWNRSLGANDISKLSLTNKDVLLAAIQTSDHELSSMGLQIPLLKPVISNVYGIGNCTYNAKVSWDIPRLPQDYLDQGYKIIKYEYYLEYYVPSGLVNADQIETYIASKELSPRVTSIKIIQTDNNNYIDLINLPYNNNYRLNIRYVLTNAEISEWTRYDLFFQDKIMKMFRLSDVTCSDETKIIEIEQKFKDENKQNRLINFFKTKLNQLK